MIDKRFPRSLNNSADSRIRGVDEMTDALNILVTGESSDGSGDGSLTGDSGVVKPINGNQVAAALGDYFDPLYEKVVIGSVEDVKEGYVYFFLFSENAAEMGVYRTTSGLNVERVYVSPYFNFRSDGFVKADVVHLNAQSADDQNRTILYFTDNVNEPRKLDINRVMQGDFGVGYDQYDIADAICACPRTPPQPPIFQFTNNPDFGKSLFKDKSPFQFAYQNVYYGGEESALSTYSAYAIPPGYLSAGNEDNPDIENVCTIRIPRDGYTREVETIRILARNSETNQFYIIDDVDADHDSPYTNYEFRNNTNLIGFPEFEVAKQFDNLPKRARAQTVNENRLFYGDYVEGFDPVQTSATISVEYQTRDQDFVSGSATIVPRVFGVGSVNQGEIRNRSVGFKIEDINLPDQIFAGDRIRTTVTLYPNQNFCIYDGRTSYHPYTENDEPPVDLQQGNVPDVSPIYQGVVNDPEDYFFGSYSKYSGSYNSEPQRNFSCFQGNITASWNVAHGVSAGQSQGAAYGTSAENALIIKATTMTFSAEIVAQTNINTSLGTQNVINALEQALVAGDAPSISEFGWDLVFSENEASYSYDLNLNHGSSIFPSSEEWELICAVMDNNAVQNFNYSKNFLPPIGSFIINRADVNFRLVQNPGVGLTLDLVSVDNVETKTCIPNFRTTAEQYTSIGSIETASRNVARVTKSTKKYLVFDANGAAINSLANNQSFIESNFQYFTNYNANTPIGQLVNQAGVNLHDIATENADVKISLSEDETAAFQYYNLLHPNLKRRFGYLLLSNPTNSIFTKYEDRDIDPSIANRENLACSICDGQVGPGGKISYGFEEIVEGGVSTGGDTYYGNQTISEGIHLMGGHIEVFQTAGTIVGAVNTNSPFLSNAVSGVLPLVKTFTDPIPTGNAAGEIFPGSNDFELLYRSNFEENQREHLLIVAYSDTDFIRAGSSTSGLRRSFKSNANHSFGIVYYDQRGRSSNVMPLGSVFVDQLGERSGLNYGPAYITITLDHDPPEWAFNYQIVHTGNTSISKFVQYTTGGAFTESNSDNLYISLNYLQGNQQISYVNAFGARSPIGDTRLYEYQAGDKLKILSFATGSDEGIFTRPQEYDFDIVGFATLTDDADSNPIYEAGDNLVDANSNKKGDFLIVKNNPAIPEFSKSAVVNNTDKWNDRCLVEIYSPAKFTDTEDSPFFEISNCFDVVFDNNGNLVHDVTNITLENGDVFWRYGAIKMPQFDIGNQDGVYQDMVIASNANFNNFYIESETFSDLVRFSNTKDFGKPKIILRNAQEVRRGSSITYGEPNSYSSNLIKFTSFNSTLGNFKDIPNSYGSINYLYAFNEFLLCIQDSKISRIPVNRNIISDASTNQQLIASISVLGNQAFFTGDYGCDGHPESVTVEDNDVYFADIGNQQIVRFNRFDGGVTPISEQGMKEFFERQFRALGDNPRIVSGFDPLHGEFIVSMYDQQTINPTGVAFVVQPDQQIDQDDDTGGGGGADRISQPLNTGSGDINDTKEYNPSPFKDIYSGVKRVPESVQDLLNQSPKGIDPRGYSRSSQIDYWLEVYNGAFPQWQKLGDFYNFGTTEGSERIPENSIFTIKNKCLIDMFGAGNTNPDYIRSTKGVYTDREFLRAANAWNRWLYVPEGTYAPNFNPYKTFKATLVSTAFVTERVDLELRNGKIQPSDMNNVNSIDPYYSAGTVNFFGTWSQRNMREILSVNPPTVSGIWDQWLHVTSDSAVHNGVLAMCDYMTPRQYFRFKNISVSPKFGLKGKPEFATSTSVIAEEGGFQVNNQMTNPLDYGSSLGEGQDIGVGWAPCAAGFQAWTENIVIPFFDQYMGQQVSDVIQQVYNQQVFGSNVPELDGFENTFENEGHYDFFQNMFSNNGTWGPLVYDFDMDGVWTQDDLDIWLALVDHWTSLGDDTGNDYRAANYFNPAPEFINGIKKLGCDFDNPQSAEVPPLFFRFLETPDIPGTYIQYLDQGFNDDRLNSQNPDSFVRSGPNQKLFNWSECLNQRPFEGANLPDDPNTSPAQTGVPLTSQFDYSISPFFNRTASDYPEDPAFIHIGPLQDPSYDFVSSLGAYWFTGSSGWDCPLIPWPQSGYMNMSMPYNTVSRFERPNDSFFPITKYWL